MAAVNVGTAGGGAFTGGAANPVETYSCDGLRRIFYNPAGTPITPGNLLFSTNGGTLLQKPDLAAADCTPSNTPGFEQPVLRDVGRGSACRGDCGAGEIGAAVAERLANPHGPQCLRPRHHGSRRGSRLRLGNCDGSRRSSIADHAGDDQLDTGGADVFHLRRRLPGGHIHNSHDFELESGYVVLRQFPLAAERRGARITRLQCGRTGLRAIRGRSRRRRLQPPIPRCLSLRRESPNRSCLRRSP